VTTQIDKDFIGLRTVSGVTDVEEILGPDLPIAKDRRRSLDRAAKWRIVCVTNGPAIPRFSASHRRA